MTSANRLADEKSPYLLQHATNPVDWYPWGDEAFRVALEEDKPIFLSVGYATCHWCHVMERESFEDEATAAVMNELFVNVKVDREEHPDVDQLYMAVVQRMTGQGGWPMSVFLTPSLEPYFAGTYFPPDARWGRPGFSELLRRCAAVHRDRRDEIAEHGKKIFAMLAEPVGTPRDIDTRAPIARATAQLESTFDETWGGFGAAPKFPRSMVLMLLLRQREAAGDADGRLLEMVEKTCEMMWRGGMYDHVGGGFARYSTDDRWLVPHFEKMLYDNALLALTYLEAHGVSGAADHLRVIRETLDWTLAEMTHPEGGFFSAQDADSEGEEGLFYLWRKEELLEILGTDDGALFAAVFGADGAPNFEGRSVLHLPASLDDAAAAAGLARDELEARIDSMRRRLYEVREERIHPLLDDKVLTSWNGLMIAAMARCGATLDEARWLDAARRSARFVLDNLSDGDRLLRRWRDGDARFPGTLEDHAFFAWGLLELFEADHDPEWLERAQAFTTSALELFGAEDGSFYLAAEDTPHLGVRMRESYDGATPSGKSVMVLVLARLAELTGDRTHHERARAAVASSAGELESWPHGLAMLCCGLDRLLADPVEVVIAAASDDDATAREMIRRVRSGFAPHTTLVVIKPSTRAALVELAPWTADKGLVDGKTAAWICRGFTCALPVTDAAEISLSDLR